ncbi:hypothetical protein Ahy_A09g043811 [Arachis hypogaea]|uniref:Uncharacterized protein n=1 Tax=Arachis hypogaea TaxID=3818 RepID=A0A445BJ91_ARAHY|nr:hypothetical protein Ahy_A09g043811 [Arachis hypogaea]
MRDLKTYLSVAPVLLSQEAVKRIRNRKKYRNALRPIIPDNACILCLTAAAGTELADAYSPDTVIASSPGKEVHDP